MQSTPLCKVRASRGPASSVPAGPLQVPCQSVGGPRCKNRANPAVAWSLPSSGLACSLPLTKNVSCVFMPTLKWRIDALCAAVPTLVAQNLGPLLAVCRFSSQISPAANLVPTPAGGKPRANHGEGRAHCVLAPPCHHPRRLPCLSLLRASAWSAAVVWHAATWFAACACDQPGHSCCARVSPLAISTLIKFL